MTSTRYDIHGDTSPSILIKCDIDGCERRYTIGGFQPGRVRKSAEAHGWKVATYADRTDICPAHAPAVS